MAAYPGARLTALGKSAPIIINILNAYSPYFSPSPAAWTLGVLVTVSPGASLTYQVEVTGDPIPSANGNWNPHDVLQGLTSSFNSNVGYPITGIRLNVTVYSSGSANMAVVQWP
jgi:hypothetical protein